MDGQSGLPGGGCQTSVGLHLATGHLGYGGLVNCVVPDNLGAAAGPGLGSCEGCCVLATWLLGPAIV